MLKILTARHKSTMAYLSNRVRRLPPYTIRVLMVVDMVFSMIFTPLTWWNYYRHTGKKLSVIGTFQIQKRSIIYFIHHLFHKDDATGFLSLDWNSPPQSQTDSVNMIISKDNHNSCGSCKNCCTTYWKKEKAVSCPYLGDSGCEVYGGVIWEYTNCGRFPVNAQSAKSYSCPRFIDILDKIELATNKHKEMSKTPLS